MNYRLSLTIGLGLLLSAAQTAFGADTVRQLLPIPIADTPEEIWKQVSAEKTNALAYRAGGGYIVNFVASSGMGTSRVFIYAQTADGRWSRIAELPEHNDYRSFYALDSTVLIYKGLVSEGETNTEMGRTALELKLRIPPTPPPAKLDAPRPSPPPSPK